MLLLRKRKSSRKLSIRVWKSLTVWRMSLLSQVRPSFRARIPLSFMIHSASLLTLQRKSLPKRASRLMRMALTELWLISARQRERPVRPLITWAPMPQFTSRLTQALLQSLTAMTRLSSMLRLLPWLSFTALMRMRKTL